MLADQMRCSTDGGDSASIIGENQTCHYLRTVHASDINKGHVVNLLDLCIMAEQWMEKR